MMNKVTETIKLIKEFKEKYPDKYKRAIKEKMPLFGLTYKALLKEGTIKGD